MLNPNTKHCSDFFQMAAHLARTPGLPLSNSTARHPNPLCKARLGQADPLSPSPDARTNLMQIHPLALR